MRRCRLGVLTLVVLVCICIGATAAPAQTQDPPTQGDDVLKVNTNLVQTDVMVFDKQGGFVEGLKREQFILKVDGKPRDISFFEQVHAGSRNEEAQLAAARGASAPIGNANKVVPLDRGRMIFFFVDDIHMDFANMTSVRALLLRFIDRDLGQNDQAAIFNASGSIGFLQQLTNNKVVLRAAVARLTSRSRSTGDLENPPMSEYQALQIDRGDIESLGYFVDQYIRNNPMTSRTTAETAVRMRASQILQQTGSLTIGTLSSLEGLTRLLAQLGGRKLIFLITDGFFIDTRHSDTLERMRAVITAASRGGSVVYSIDSRGLVASTTDLSTNTPFDPSGRLARTDMGEVASSQDGMNALAQDTGGRAFFGNNSLSESVATALKESSVYYLLAWRPENAEQGSSRFRRIEVAVNGRTDLIVRFRSGFGEPTARAKSQETVARPKTPAETLRTALGANFPTIGLPMFLTLNFLDYPERGPVVATSAKILTDKSNFAGVAGALTITIDLAGALFDSQGKTVSSFSQHFTVRPNSPDAKPKPPDNVLYNHFFDAKPGLYQVRVAAIDHNQGLVGSSAQWIEVPDLASNALALSTLIVGERRSRPEEKASGLDLTKQGDNARLPSVTSLNVEHRFNRSSYLRFLTFIYHAVGGGSGGSSGLLPKPENQTTSATVATVGAANGSPPDLAVQVHVFRDDQPVFTDPLHKISVEGITDLTRLPYAAELNLATFQPGRYVLQVTVIDRRARASAVQRFDFAVD